MTRCLSVQHALGTRSEHPTVSGKLAWVALNLKLTSVTLHYANNIINNNLAEAAQPGMLLGVLVATKLTTFTRATDFSARHRQMVVRYRRPSLGRRSFSHAGRAR